MLRVLHLDTDPGWHERVRSILADEKEITVDSRTPASDFPCSQDGEPWDVIIAEYSMNGVTAGSFLQGLASRGITAPVVILTGSPDRTAPGECLRSGAAWFIRKEDFTAASRQALAGGIRNLAVQHRDRELLAQENRIMNSILRAAPLALCIVRDHVIVWCNACMHQALGYSEGELAGKDPILLMADEVQHARIDAGLFSRKGAGSWGAVDGELRKKDGSVLSCHLIARPVNESNPAEGHIIIGQDVTQYQQMAQLLRMSELRIRDLIDNAKSIILRVDRGGVLRFINRYGESFFGFSADELVGKNVLDTIVPSKSRSGRDLRAMVRDVLENPDDFEINVNENIRKNGERVWIAWTNRPIRDESGRIREILCIGNDISDRKLDVDDVRISLAPWKNSIIRDTDIEDVVFESVYDISVEISREGREGKWVGTTFLIGDAKNVLANSRQLILNPFEGHRPEIRMITHPELAETVKELSQLDGAFVIDGHGLVEAAGRYITIDTSRTTIPKGMGTRHASVAAITEVTKAIGVVVSQSGGRISIFKDGRLVRVITHAE